MLTVKYLKHYSTNIIINMIPYFVVLLISLLFMAAYQSTKNKIFLVLCAVPMIILIGFRSAVVGTDTGGYCRSFLDKVNYSLSSDTLKEFSTEPGWNMLNLLLVRLGQYYFIILTAVGSVCTVAALYVINKLSDFKTLSLFIYFTLSFYLFAFAASRQAFAIAVYMCSLPHLINGNFKKYAIWVVAATMFHQTALVALPLYFFFRLPFSKKILTLSVVGGLVTGALIPEIMAFAATVEDRYSVYTEYEGGGEMFTVFYLILSVFFIMQRSKIQLKYLKKYDILLNMLIFGSLIYVVVTLSGLYGEVTRFAAYFQISVMILWAYLYKHRITPLSSLFWLITIIGHMGYFYIYLSKIGHIVPYVFNTAFA